MSLIVTPKQLSYRAEFYQRLHQLIAAGIGLLQALETTRRSPPHPSYRAPLAAVLASLSDGASFSESLHAMGRWIPAFDIAMLDAGERSGRLPEVLKLLGDYYQTGAQMARQSLSALMYPLFLLHFAIFIGPFPELFRTGNLWAYAVQTFGVLVPLYGVVGLIAYAAQSWHGESWRALVERLTRMIPVVGSARRALALGRLSASLEALINAGVPIVQAWPLAATASGSPALRRAVSQWPPELESGITPAEVMLNHREFPEFFTNMYHTGEVSGQLDDSLRRLHVYYQDEGSRKMRAIAEWTPKLIYFGIVGIIAWRVVSFWIGYYRQISDVLNF